MAYLLQSDANGTPIPILQPANAAGAAQSVTATAGAARSAPFNNGTQRITMLATADLCFKLGGESVTAAATDHFIGAGERLVLDVRSFSHVSIHGTGTLHISELV